MTMGDVVAPGSDCPRCSGIGYVVSEARSVSRTAMFGGASMPTISLAEVDAVAKYANKHSVYKPCDACMGSGVWCTLEDIEAWIDAIVINEEFVHEQGLCLRMNLVTVSQNVHDLVDTGASVLLRSEEVRQLFNAFLAVRFDAERKLLASGSVPPELEDV